MFHAMLDIETLSTRPNAAIIEVGVVLFDPVNLNIRTSYGFAVPGSIQGSDRHIDWDTLRFWSEQPAFVDKMKASCEADLDPLPEETLVADLRNAVGVWGNGADFDNVILRSYLTGCAGYNEDELWPYYKNRCFRTFANLYDPQKLQRPRKNNHTAVEDAQNQVEWMFHIIAHNKLQHLFMGES